MPLLVPSFNEATELNRSYHDDEPVQAAQFDIAYNDGRRFSGALDGVGHADLSQAPNGVGQVKFGPDARTWQSKGQDLNPSHRATWTQSDCHASANMHSGRVS